ncbi:hypothetical protein [Caldivirga maquilingensis]|uniref:Uncharacterized protein n=1 Tax=Caldivirga maquilingensis (strain ATCC 700844 / DSM 13496 / JCM 10307 / IC-167) TaxID=397948 RepID=A8ME89_CALMQ|nr:hypothetical protein [Caldivirga maquilingensis]ABW02095.1 hypothetical protein Cmaq_1268 [Caldivirga maquilingensis IC-167]
MSSISKEVDGEVVRVVINPPQGVSTDKLIQYLRGVLGIEGEVVNGMVSIVVTMNRSELGGEADKLADEIISKLNSVNWDEVAKYKVPTTEPKKHRRRRRKSRKSRRSRSKSRK